MKNIITFMIILTMVVGIATSVQAKRGADGQLKLALLAGTINYEPQSFRGYKGA